MNETNKEVLCFQAKRIFNAVAKRLLIQLEDIQNDHNIHYAKLRAHLPDQYQNLIDQADYLDQNKFNHYRKRILDFIGDGFRETNEEIERYME